MEFKGYSKETIRRTCTALREAADLMIEKGFVAGKRYDIGTGAHCALGALDEAVCRQSLCDYNLPYNALAEMATEFIPEKGVVDTYNGKITVKKDSNNHWKIAAWNNMIAKSASAVACVMRATAAWIEESCDEKVKKGGTNGTITSNRTAG